MQERALRTSFATSMFAGFAEATRHKREARRALETMLASSASLSLCKGFQVFENVYRYPGGRQSAHMHTPCRERIHLIGVYADKHRTHSTARVPPKLTLILIVPTAPAP